MSSGTIAQLDGVWDFRIRAELADRIASVLGVSRDELFTRELVSPELRGKRSRPPMAPDERGSGANSTEAAQACKRYCEEHGFWTRKQAAEFLKVTRHTVTEYAQRGLLAKPKIIQFGNVRFTLFRRSDVMTLAREHSRDALQRARWYERRHKSTAMYGRLAPALSEAKGKKVGRPRALSEEEAQRITELREMGRSERAIARIIGLSPAQVHRFLASREGGFEAVSSA